MNKTKKISYLGIGTALYVAISIFVKIPLVNRIRFEMGYAVFGLYIPTFSYAASFVGVAGCILSNMLTGGSFPLAWAVGQLFTGLMTAFVCKKTENTVIRCIFGAVAVFIGVGLIKTFLEILIFRFPFWAKFTSNLVAVVADAIPFLIGIGLSKKFRLK